MTQSRPVLEKEVKQIGMDVQFLGDLAHRHSLLGDRLDRIHLELTGKITTLIFFPHNHASCNILLIFMAVRTGKAQVEMNKAGPFLTLLAF